jgi:gliding motility-associated protein GldE
MIATLVCLLLVSALVSGAETSFFSLKHADLQEIKSTAERPAHRAILQLLEDVDMLLAAILVTNNLVNICIVILVARIIDSYFLFHSVALQFLFESVIATFLLLLFGEIIPKVAAQNRPMSFALFVARPMVWIKRAVHPLARILVHTSSTISEHATHKAELSLEELADAVDLTATSSTEEHDMLSGIVRFSGTEVVDIMKPRMDVVAVSIHEEYRTIRERIIQTGYSRIPVYGEDLDDVKGVLYVKDLLPYISATDSFNWKQLLRKAYFVPEHKRINDLLEEFQSNKIHLAIVVDEYGSTLGIVSLEDVLEEIVGEISDENDAVKCAYTRLDDHNYIFEGKMRIGEFERILQLQEDALSDVKGEAETLAGLMLEVKRDFLRKGESITLHGLRLTVLTLEGRRIDRIKVTLLE